MHWFVSGFQRVARIALRGTRPFIIWWRVYRTWQSRRYKNRWLCPLNNSLSFLWLFEHKHFPILISLIFASSLCLKWLNEIPIWNVFFFLYRPDPFKALIDKSIYFMSWLVLDILLIYIILWNHVGCIILMNNLYKDLKYSLDHSNYSSAWKWNDYKWIFFVGYFHFKNISLLFFLVTFTH